MIKAENIAYEVDVWDVMEKHLNTGLVDVLDLSFKFSSDEGIGLINIRHPKDSRISTKRIELDRERTGDLISELGTKFNFRWFSIASLSFELKPCEIPIFRATYYPYVNDPSMLNKKKSRMNPITID